MFSLALGIVLLLHATGGVAQTPATKLRLTADRTELKAGERVRVSVVPLEVARQYSFAVGFQDGPVEVLPAGQNYVEHDYVVPGTYTVSVTPRPTEEPAPRLPEFSSSRVNIHLAG